MEQTVKELTIKLNERDFTTLKERAQYYLLSPEGLINYMIGDLICGENTLGSDERMLMLDWYERAGVNFETFDEFALEEQLEQMFIDYTKYLNEHGVSKQITDSITFEEVKYAMTEKYDKFPDLFSIRYNPTYPEDRQMEFFTFVFKDSYREEVQEVFESFYEEGTVSVDEAIAYLDFIFKRK